MIQDRYDEFKVSGHMVSHSANGHDEGTTFLLLLGAPVVFLVTD